MKKLDDVIFVHRLRHGLTTIKWGLKMILSGDFGEVPSEQRSIIQKTLEENEILILLASDLLTGSTYRSYKNFLTKSLCDIGELINDSVKTYETKIAEKKLTVNFQAPVKKIEANTDREKIKVAIQNILDNAIKYSPVGEKIEISLDKDDNKKVNIKIQDHGIGIPESQKKKIFTKFFRGTNATQTNQDGSGLGLFIVKNIIEAHEGKIWFKSKAGARSVSGTTFFISLPVK